MLVNNNSYKEALNNIISEINKSRAEAQRSVNSELIKLYWNIGKNLSENNDWGAKIIDSLSHDIRAEFPGIKGFSPRNLKYMQKFAREFSYDLCNSCCTIPWGHIVLLLNKTEKGREREWYLSETLTNGWSRAALEHQVDLKLYERQAIGNKVTNFEHHLPAPDSDLSQQALKDPYVFDFTTTRQGKDERDLEDEMMNNVSKLLLELGTGFAFLGRQFHLVVGGEDFYVDLLFYNVPLHRYVVVELKNSEFKPEFAGKLGFYTSAIDGELTGEGDNPTIGLLLCKSKNNVVAKYSLNTISAPIGVSEYKVQDELPKEYENILPSPEDLITRI